MGGGLPPLRSKSGNDQEGWALGIGAAVMSGVKSKIMVAASCMYIVVRILIGSSQDSVDSYANG